MYRLLWVVNLLLVLVRGILGVAFITLMERKLLSLSQVRLGPNKVTMFGILQPVFDGLKLLGKQLILSNPTQIVVLLSPLLIFGVFIALWRLLINWEGTLFLYKYERLAFFFILGIGSYTIILTGWRIIRRFSKIGRLRSILQRLSYEVAFILLLLVTLSSQYRMGFKDNLKLRIELLLLWALLWLILALMESNRAPFDLLEGERELIRGFNVEMGSIIFIYLFLREYGIIIILSSILTIIIFNTILYGIVVSCLILLIRRCYPRIRYDTLMEFIWVLVLPTVLFLFILITLLK
jgi:NADH:ubiquinone oxidoreductase subunit H